jgi:predicted NBD/HSP70 family sugar kinase
MARRNGEQANLPVHGGLLLPRVAVRSYNVEIEDEDGFLGDRANKGAFWELLEKWRRPLKEMGCDPLGDKSGEEIGKRKLASLLVDGSPEAAGVVHGAVEEFARQLATVVRRFLRLKEWRDSECLVIGGGFRASRIGELAIGRAAVLLKADGVNVDLELIRNDPDEAGLIGAAHLLPTWMLKGHDAILAVDVGGTNIRTGVVELRRKRNTDLVEPGLTESELWRHSEEDIDRDAAVARLIEMLGDLIERARKGKVRLAPVIGIGCPGVIREDGTIGRGAQNLPGNWASSRFNLPARVREAIPKIGESETFVVIHNDAVVQGLSELPRVLHRQHWGVLTIGTGFGNASFRARRPAKAKRSE